MDENLANTTERLNASLDTWPAWDAGLSGRPAVVAALGGLSNQSYLVINDDVKLVVRLNGATGKFGVDRCLEEAILNELRDAPFAPSLIYRDEKIDFVVTRYERGTHIDPNEIQQQLGAIAALFGDIHECKIGIEATLDPMEQAGRYFKQLDDPGNQSLTWCYERLASRVISPAGRHCLCHNDLLLENIIKSDTTLIALDWEYASRGDPAFDLAVFIETYQLDNPALSAFLDAYHGPAVSAARINDYRLVYRLIEILWWMLRDPAHPSIVGKLTYLEHQIKANT